MQESYLSLPVFSSEPLMRDEKAHRRFCFRRIFPRAADTAFQCFFAILDLRAIIQMFFIFL